MDGLVWEGWRCEQMVPKQGARVRLAQGGLIESWQSTAYQDLLLKVLLFRCCSIRWLHFLFFQVFRLFPNGRSFFRWRLKSCSFDRWSYRSKGGVWRAVRSKHGTVSNGAFSKVWSLECYLSNEVSNGGGLEKLMREVIFYFYDFFFGFCCFNFSSVFFACCACCVGDMFAGIDCRFHPMEISRLV